MMREWNDRFNPFNSLKVLMYPDHLKGYAREDYLPPVTVAIDPSNRCNLDCMWCNARTAMKKDKAMMTVKETEKLAKFFHKWGIKGTCITGGGEPLMNKDAVNSLLVECYDYKISNSLITNGTLMDDETIANIAYTCRWVGVSVDTSNKKTFKKLKKLDKFDKVIENIKKIRKKIDESNSKCQIGFKFLLHPDNSNEIYDAVELAKKIGAHDFQLRPSAILGKKFTYFHDMVNRQIEKALELSDKNFNVYCVRHKYKKDFNSLFDFKFCRSCAIHPVFSADGSVELCIDRKGDKSLTLCNWKTDDVLKYWNSEKHKKILRNVDFKDCPKCTFIEYEKIVERVFMSDQMCRSHV